MTAASKDRYGERQPSELCPYTGASGYTYYKHTMLKHDADGTGIHPAASGSGVSGSHFIGVAANGVDLSAGLGASQMTLNVWKTGEFTFAVNGTGVSAHIGQRAYILDDQTVGVCIGAPCLTAGEIVGIPSTSTYRVRIDNAVNLGFNDHGVSWEWDQN